MNHQEQRETKRWHIGLIFTIIFGILGLVIAIVGIIVPVITTRQMQPEPSSSGMAIPD